MRIRRSVLVICLLAAPLAVLGGPADATPPNSGCAVGWSLSPTFDIPLFVASDNANHDGLVCVRNLSNLKGTVVHDNTSAATTGWDL
jgi:hypothetical protein